MPGRGGAGNILQAQEQSKKANEDVENGQPSSVTAPSAAEPLPSAPLPEYAHSGRGGAGNWYAPGALSATGTFTSTTDDTANPSADATVLPTASRPQISTPWHPEGQVLPSARTGRGGAGNFTWESAEEHKRREKEEREELARKEESVREDVRKGVEEGLKRPDGVVLGGQRAGRGW